MVGSQITPMLGEGEFGREFVEYGGLGIQVVKKAKLGGWSGAVWKKRSQGVT